jgi:hypothetical protein
LEGGNVAENDDVVEVASVGLGHRKKCSVEIVPAGRLEGTLEAECFELDPALQPTDIITDRQSFRVRVKWCVIGELRRHLCGTWCIQIAWESCGSGPEGEWHRDIDFDGCDEDGCYQLDFDFPPGRLPAGECGTVYCLCVTLSSKRVCGERKYVGLIHGFCKDVCCIMVRPG